MLTGEYGAARATGPLDMTTHNAAVTWADIGMTPVDYEAIKKRRGPVCYH